MVTPVDHSLSVVNVNSTNFGETSLHCLHIDEGVIETLHVNALNAMVVCEVHTRILSTSMYICIDRKHNLIAVTRISIEVKCSSQTNKEITNCVTCTGNMKEYVQWICKEPACGSTELLKRKETQPLPPTLVPQGFRCAFKMSGAKAVLKAKRYSNSQGNGKQKITRVSGVRVEFRLSCLKLIKRQGFTILSIILPYNSLLIRTFGFNWEFLAKILITYQGQNEGWFRTFRTLINVNKKISTRHQLCSDNII